MSDNKDHDTNKQYTDEDIETLYRQYQSTRNTPDDAARNTPDDAADNVAHDQIINQSDMTSLIVEFNQVDKNSPEFKAYERQRDRHWDDIVHRVKTRTNQKKQPGGMKLSKWSTYFMLAGIIFGLLLHPFLAENTTGVKYLIGGFSTFGEYFISSLKYAAIPLVIISLIDGIISVDKSNSLWRIGRKSLFLYLITTVMAITLALVLTTIIGLGTGHTAADYDSGNRTDVDMITSGFTNPLAAMINGDMIPAILLALFVAMAIRSSGNNVPLIHQAIHQINKVMQTMLGFILWLVPVVIFSLTTTVMAKLGGEAIVQMLAYFLIVIGLLVLHLTVSYSLLLYYVKLDPWMFFQKMLAVKFFAFGTSSSNATAPINIKNAENRLGISKPISSLVIPLGATMNMDGTAIMLSVVSIFGVNLFGIDLSILQYLMLLITILFASVAVAGIPKGALAVLATLLIGSVGLKPEDAATLIGIVMALDHLLDMLRTAVNVTGDAAIACVIAKSESGLNDKIFDDPDACCIMEQNFSPPQKD